MYMWINEKKKEERQNQYQSHSFGFKSYLCSQVASKTTVKSNLKLYWGPSTVAHICKIRCSRGKDQEDSSFEADPGKKQEFLCEK
jgi:hypothetical protein